MGSESTGVAGRQTLAGLSGSPIVTVAAVLLPVVVVLALAGYHLGRQPYWLDEALTVAFVTQPWNQMLAIVFGREANMAGYYLPLSAWVQLGSTNESWVRLPSLLAAAGAAGLLVVLGRLLFDLQVGFIAGLLLACNPMLLTYARDARSYGLVTLAAVVTTLALVRALQRPSAVRWIVWGVLAGLGLWLQFMFALLVIAHGVIVIGRRHSVSVRSALVGLVPLALIAAPIGVLAATHVSGQTDWVAPFSLSTATGELTTLAGGTILAVAIALAVLVIVRRWRDPSVTLILTWLVVPVAILLAVSVLKPLLISRWVIVVIPAASLVLAVAAVALGRRVPILVGIITFALVLAAMPGVAVLHTAQRDDWRAAAAWLVDKAEPGDQIVFIGQRRLHGQSVLDVYLRRSGAPDLVYVSRSEPDLIPTGRTWVVLNHAPWAWTKPVLDRLEVTGGRRARGQFRGVDVYLYVPDPVGG